MLFWVENDIFLWICLFWPTSSKNHVYFFSVTISRGTPSDIWRNPRVPAESRLRNPGLDAWVFLPVSSHARKPVIVNSTSYVLLCFVASHKAVTCAARWSVLLQMVYHPWTYYRYCKHELGYKSWNNNHTYV